MNADHTMIYILSHFRYKRFLHDLAANMSPNNLEFEQMSRKSLFFIGLFLSQVCNDIIHINSALVQWHGNTLQVTIKTSLLDFFFSQTGSVQLTLNDVP